MNIFVDTATATLLRTLLQMGGAALVTYGVVSAADWATAMTHVNTILGGVAGLGGLFGLAKAKGWL